VVEERKNATAPFLKGGEGGGNSWGGKRSDLKGGTWCRYEHRESFISVKGKD